MGCNCGKKAKKKHEPLIDGERTKRRMSICATCEHLKRPDSITKQCSICGCMIEAKARIGAMVCPLGKWK